MADANTLDYVIVGSGAGGSTLAYRLGENPDVKILVLEAGGNATESPMWPAIQSPYRWNELLLTEA